MGAHAPPCRAIGVMAASGRCTSFLWVMGRLDRFLSEWADRLLDTILPVDRGRQQPAIDRGDTILPLTPPPPSLRARHPPSCSTLLPPRSVLPLLPRTRH